MIARLLPSFPVVPKSPAELPPSGDAAPGVAVRCGRSGIWRPAPARAPLASALPHRPRAIEAPPTPLPTPTHGKSRRDLPSAPCSRLSGPPGENEGGAIKFNGTRGRGERERARAYRGARTAA